MDTERKSNFELLRILCMILILLGHYVGKGGLAVLSEPFLNHIISLFFWGFGKLGVNVFVLISGYFAGHGNNSSEKIIRLYLQISFYAILSFCLYYIFAREEINATMFWDTIFPVSKNVYWFMTSYLGLMLFSPIIDKVITTLSEINYRKLLIITFIMLTVIPTIVYKGLPYNSNLFWFIFLYILGYAIKRFKITRTSRGSIICGMSFWIIMWLMDLLLETYTLVEKNYFSYMYRLPMLIASLSLFFIFKNLEIGCKVNINKVAKVTLGIYLLSDSLFLRVYLWNSILKCENFWYSKWFLPHLFISSILTFIICGLIEALREKLYSVYIYRSRAYAKCALILDKLVIKHEN